MGSADLPRSFVGSLETVATQSEMAEKIKHDPPQIIFMAEPAILVTIDGEPRLVREKESSLMRVVNTPFTILLAPEPPTYYLNANQKTWYMASDIKGEWRVADQVPTAVAARAPKPADEAEKTGSDDDLESGPPPKIVVATEPTELISSTGKPEYTPIKDTGLLYLSNSDSDVFMAIESQEIYILLAGRWFSGKSLNGPWQYVPGENCPLILPRFLKIQSWRWFSMLCPEPRPPARRLSKRKSPRLPRLIAKMPRLKSSMTASPVLKR